MYSDVNKDKRFLELGKLLRELEQEYGLSKKQIIELSEEIIIPISIFNENLSAFETIVKYLIENRAFTLRNASIITNRTKQGVWQAYHNAKKKYPRKFLVESSPYDFPLSIISDKRYSILESIVVYLRDSYQLSYAKIASLLCRDQRTIWTVYNRAKKK